MTPLSAAIERVSLLGPGLASWDAARQVLAGKAPYGPGPTAVPQPALLPPNERRRSGQAVRIALAVGDDPPAGIATVFASSSADGDTCHAICEQLAGDERLISPTRFHNSVHNAPSGYWSIATRNMSPSTSLCAYDGSFAAGLLEACATLHASARPVLLIAYDAPYPEPLRAKRPVPDVFGLSLLLAPAPGPASLARIELGCAASAPDVLADAGLEALRRAIPAARALPLLRLLALGRSGTVVVDYLEDLGLTARVRPCP
jgi:hypothetical protein